MVDRYNYSCDCGSLLVGNAGCVTRFPNVFGDGCWEVVIQSVDEPIPDFIKYAYVGGIEGMDIHVYNYDCFHHLDDYVNEDNILCTLHGDYQVFARRGDTGDMLIRQINTRRWDTDDR